MSHSRLALTKAAQNVINLSTQYYVCTVSPYGSVTQDNSKRPARISRDISAAQISIRQLVHKFAQLAGSRVKNTVPVAYGPSFQPTQIFDYHRKLGSALADFVC